MEQEYEVKPVQVKNSEQFEKMAEELLKGWTEYKKIRNRMELLDASIKKYMVDNELKFYENEYGHVSIVEQGRRVLDRSLIEDIERYKVDTKFKMMFKSPKN